MKPTTVRPTCGSRNGYKLHRYYRETTCTPCRHANSGYVAGRRRVSKAAS